MRNKLFKIIILICLSIPGPLYASQQDTPLTATVNVESVFKISIQSSSIDFGAVEPGSSSAKKNVGISCLTNNNRSWSVSLYAQSPLSYDAYEIPNSNFKWETQVTEGTGQAAQSGIMGITPVNFYIAGMDDYITETPVELVLSLSIDVPQGQVAGQYGTVVVITMHEE